MLIDMHLGSLGNPAKEVFACISTYLPKISADYAGNEA